MRIVSLLPSATETLRLLAGPDDSRIHLVGRSHECDFPAGVKGIPALTGQRTVYTTPAAVDRAVRDQLAAGRSLYTLDTQMLAALRPDIILTQDLCEVCSIDLETVRQVAATLSPAPRVLSFNPRSAEDVLDDILRLGEAIDRAGEARRAVVSLRERLARATEHVPAFAAAPSVAFLEWTDPIFVGGHWTPQLIERAGGAHPPNPTVPCPGAGAATGAMQSERLAGKSIRITPDTLVASRPEVVIICPCGLDLDQTRRAAADLARQPWFAELPATRAGRIALVDGSQMFNRPGPRLVDAQEWLVGWLQGRPELIPPGFPWQPWRP
jgi:iron complex transport system substrate-binding protein